MRASTIRALEELAGNALDGTIVGEFKIGVDPIQIRRGVYMVFDVLGRCVYVGKATSLLDARRVNTRIVSEHLANLKKREAFDTCYVLPVRTMATDTTLEVLEGWVSRHLKPSMGRRAPRIRRPG